MSDTKHDLARIFKVFPSASDMALWDVLSPAEKRAFIERSEQAGFESGMAPDETIAQRLARVRATGG